mgnify:CR=1 FL=1
MKKAWAQKQTGFTIVELLIVIVVIAILAAVSIVAYNGIQDRAKFTQQVAEVDRVEGPAEEADGTGWGPGRQVSRARARRPARSTSAR